MRHTKSFWINLALINLCIVALLGFTLRSKILFPLPFIDFRNLLSAHSHFAFSGWAGLALITLMIFDLLPEPLCKKNIYRIILWGIEISSLGMALSFPFQGYGLFSIFFSSAYIFITFVLAWIFIRDLAKTGLEKSIKLMAVSAVLSLVISSLGPFTLSYMLMTGSFDSILYRDSIYTFLHFQYNGFFTLSVLALMFFNLLKQNSLPRLRSINFATCLCLSVVPALFLALLWHNNRFFYALGSVACVLILLSFVYFMLILTKLNNRQLFSNRTARSFWIFAMIAFLLKMTLQVGTIFPQLGNAVYGDRPVIIGFLHLVFLGFISFYIISNLLNDRYFEKNGRTARLPFIVFSAGIIGNELLLMLQGLQILFQSNSSIYSWLLWIASILLLGGAVMIAVSRSTRERSIKRATQAAPIIEA